MPYEWSETPEGRRLRLWPYRSLPPRGFAFVIGLFFLLLLLATWTSSINLAEPMVATLQGWGSSAAARRPAWALRCGR